MSTQYQIDKEKALQDFLSKAKQAVEAVQLILPIPDVVEWAQQGMNKLLVSVMRELITSVMEEEVRSLAGRRHQRDGGEVYRWGTEQGYCIIDGQKVPIPRPRLRNSRTKLEVPLGSYEMFQRGSLVEETVWNRIMSGLTMRKYSDVIQQFTDAYGIEKSSISEHFIEASRSKLEKLMQRRLDKMALVAVVIDGTIFKSQHMIVAIGICVDGQKRVLGLQQGASENATVTGHLLSDLEERGMDFSVPRLYLLDGSKALSTAVRRKAGDAAFVQRCQLHKIRNVMDHLPEEHKHAFRFRLEAAYKMISYSEAKRALERVFRELMYLNPSAARSLEEGMEDTLTLHRIAVPEKLRPTLRSTNGIESMFSMVDTICRNVRHWQGGDHRLRWVGSALVYAESRWNRVRGHKFLYMLVRQMDKHFKPTCQTKAAGAA